MSVLFSSLGRYRYSTKKKRTTDGPYGRSKQKLSARQKSILDVTMNRLRRVLLLGGLWDLPPILQNALGRSAIY